ncbi:hypothetical protein AVEN_114585-1, partial [Araneus ventricosus]
QDLFDKMMDALQSLEKEVCADADLADYHSRGVKSFVRHLFKI